MKHLSVKTSPAPQHLFSTLEKRIAALPMQKANVKQWRATILNIKKNGIREEELFWSCLWNHLSALDEHQKLNKDDLIAAINFSNINLELSTEFIRDAEGGLKLVEVAQRLPRESLYKAALKLDDDCHRILRYVDGRRN